MKDYLPSKSALLEALETRVTPKTWERFDEVERDTVALIIRGRCAKTIEAAFAEFAELIMRTPKKTEKP